MPLATTSALETLKMLLQAEDPAWRSGATRYLAAHTANPGVGGSQTTRSRSPGTPSVVAGMIGVSRLNMTYESAPETYEDERLCWWWSRLGR